MKVRVLEGEITKLMSEYRNTQLAGVFLRPAASRATMRGAGVPAAAGTRGPVPLLAAREPEGTSRARRVRARRFRHKQTATIPRAELAAGARPDVASHNVYYIQWLRSRWRRNIGYNGTLCVASDEPASRGIPT